MQSYLVVLLSTGCVSFGASVTTNAPLGDGPVRRVGGSIHVGTFAEIVEDQLVGQLLYTRDLGPLGGQSNIVGAWGARIATLGHGRVPGLYLMGAYGQHDQATEPPATSIIAGAGIIYGRIRPGMGGHGRGLGSIGLGLVYHRQRQATVDGNSPSAFLGLELTVMSGLDLFGPMFGAGNDD